MHRSHRLPWRCLWRHVIACLIVSGLIACGDAGGPTVLETAAEVDMPAISRTVLPAELDDPVRELTQLYLRQIESDFAVAQRRLDTLADRIASLLDAPSQMTLSAARSAWLQAHVSYEITTLHRRFVESLGTDSAALSLLELEYRINQWPILPGYLDAVSGFGESGLVFDPTVAITPSSLRELHGQFELTEAATGFHVLEFLLWGENQPLTGLRPVSDLRAVTQLTQTQEIAGYALNALPNNRRRALLNTVTEVLLADFATTNDTVTLALSNLTASLPEYHSGQLVYLLTDSLLALLSDEILVRSLYPMLNGNFTQAMQSPFSGATQNAIVAQLGSIEQLLLGLQSTGGVSLDELLVNLTPDFGEFFYQNFDASKECLVLLYTRITPPATSEERIANEFEIVACINLLNNMIDHLQQAQDQLQAAD